jgi:hypothetical protein
MPGANASGDSARNIANANGVETSGETMIDGNGTAGGIGTTGGTKPSARRVIDEQTIAAEAYRRS